MSWTDPSDVTEAWIGEDAPTNPALIQRWIDKAEREIRFRVPDLQARIDVEAELLPPRIDLQEAAVDVTVAMVTRVFRNPEGIRQMNTTTGPYTESQTYGGDVPGGLGMTSDELEKLSSKVANGAFSIDMIPASSPFSPLYTNPVWP